MRIHIFKHLETKTILKFVDGTYEFNNFFKGQNLYHYRYIGTVNLEKGQKK